MYDSKLVSIETALPDFERLADFGEPNPAFYALLLEIRVLGVIKLTESLTDGAEYYSIVNALLPAHGRRAAAENEHELVRGYRAAVARIRNEVWLERARTAIGRTADPRA